MFLKISGEVFIPWLLVSQGPYIAGNMLQFGANGKPDTVNTPGIRWKPLSEKSIAAGHLI